MSVSYEAARRVALGLEKQQREVITEDPWSVSMGDGFSFAVAEMPFQSFEHPFEPLPEQIAQKSALMLYDDEFEADRTEAEGRLSRLEQALEAGDFPALSALLAEAPVEEWMSLIWFDGVKNFRRCWKRPPRNAAPAWGTPWKREFPGWLILPRC